MQEVKGFIPGDMYDVSAIAQILKVKRWAVKGWMLRGYPVQSISQGKIIKTIYKLPFRHIGRPKKSYGYEVINFLTQINK